MEVPVPWLKRAYEPARSNDGYRVLVERLLPRVVSRRKANLDAWANDLAPSNELRRWYQHDPETWKEFHAENHQTQVATVLDEIPGILVR